MCCLVVVGATTDSSRDEAGQRQGIRVDRKMGHVKDGADIYRGTKVVRWL